MSFDPNYKPDSIDWQILEALQDDARISYTAIGKQIGLSRPSVSERIKRLEEVGIITGYRAVVDPSKLGLTITAFIKIDTNKKDDAKELTQILLDMEEVQQVYRGTGGACFTIQVVVSSIEHLDVILENILDYGSPTTTIMLASLIRNRKFTRKISDVITQP